MTIVLLIMLAIFLIFVYMFREEHKKLKKEMLDDLKMINNIYDWKNKYLVREVWKKEIIEVNEKKELEIWEIYSVWDFRFEVLKLIK